MIHTPRHGPAHDVASGPAPPTLTIGQLASYAGVTTRAIRHYHHAGLLQEPSRDASGYRAYDAADVVRLIRIRTLAHAGIPLARVHEVLDADPTTFAHAIDEIDDDLRRRIRELQQHRRRIAQLEFGDALSLPHEVVDYLDRLRAMGIPEEVVAPERDIWIMFAARWPEAIPEMMADKVAQLDNPVVVRLYHLIGRLPERSGDEQLLNDIADLIIESHEQTLRGEIPEQQRQFAADQELIRLMDSFARRAHPDVHRLQELVSERGWTGWSWIEKRS